MTQHRKTTPMVADTIDVDMPLTQKQRKAKPPAERRMIAWDGEGMNLSGAGKPQHYVLYGCSARPDDPLVITKPTENLGFFELADYMVDTAERFPKSFHVGYGFGYDQNMIARSLLWSQKRALYEKGEVWIRKDVDTRYHLSWVPKKMISINRVVTKKQGGKDVRKVSSIKIEDIVSFFATSFISAYTRTFPDSPKDHSWEIIVKGKASRGANKWEDLGKVREYWRVEILALERLANGLRELMWSNGFYLMQWYGPGAFANYLRRVHKLTAHEWGGKEINIAKSEVNRTFVGDLHKAIKTAFFGGHFEQYSGGRSLDPVYGYDLNSAYPAAFATVPTMREGGHWEALSRVQARSDSHNPEQPLTVYYVDYKGRDPEQHAMFQTAPMPLPTRHRSGAVSYQPVVTGWYWSPEIQAIHRSRRWSGKLFILRAYRWVPADDSRPWRDVVVPMYERRSQLKAENNPAEMVWKLGPNSLYGKSAQRVGWDAEKKTPPKAHTLCIAGYITSWCRARILEMIDAMDDSQLIAVETDGVYTTAPPEQIRERWPEVKFSKRLGDWGIDLYDSVIYLQNGVYLTCNNGKWKAKTRGYSEDALPYDVVQHYAASCKANKEWEPLQVDNGEQFLGLGLSIHRSKTEDGNIIATKAQRMHCVWYPDHKDVNPTGAASSKRRHTSVVCEACRSGLSLDEGLHTLHINMVLNGGRGYVSYPYTLPWETKEKEKWRDHIGVSTDRVSDMPRATHLGQQNPQPAGRSHYPVDTAQSLRDRSSQSRR
jgi:hypothetical protein